MLLILFTVAASLSSFVPLTNHATFHRQSQKFNKRQEHFTAIVNFYDDEFSRCAGTSIHGGAIYAETTKEFTVRDCEFTSCFVTGPSVSGGAIYVIPGRAEAQLKISIRDSEFTRCNCTGNGGAIYATRMAEFHCRDVESTLCSAENGGHIYLVLIGGNNFIRDSEFKSGKAQSTPSPSNGRSACGGAIFSLFEHINATVYIRDCEFKRCSAEQTGGALYLTRNEPTLFASNGGVSVVTIRDCEFSLNTALGTDEAASDVYITKSAAEGLAQHAFTDSTSTSSTPKVIVEGEGDKSSFLPADHTSAGEIVGAVFGSLAAIGVIAALVFCFCCACCPLAICLQRSRQSAKGNETQTLLVNANAQHTDKGLADPRFNPATNAQPTTFTAPPPPFQLPPYQGQPKEHAPVQHPQPPTYPVYSPAFEPPNPAASHRHVLAM